MKIVGKDGRNKNKLEAEETQVREAIERQVKSYEQLLALLGKKHIGKTEKQQLEQDVQKRVNEKFKIVGSQFQCVSVVLMKESSNKYVGFTKLANEGVAKVVNVEITTDDDGRLLGMEMESIYKDG